MPVYDDLPTELAELVKYVADLQPRHIHLHVPAADERASPQGWIDFAEAGDFADGMKKITALMRAAIFIVRDHQRLVSAVAQLVQVAAAQQAQLEELRQAVEDVRNARVAVAAQKVAAEMIDRLTDKGTAADQVEVHIRHREQESHDRVEQSAADNDRQRRTDVRGKIGGLAKLLGSLDAKADVGETEITRELAIASETNSQTRHVDLTFKLGGVQPAADPRAHTEALIARRQFEASQRQPALPRGSGTADGHGDEG